ncbi:MULTISPECIES: helix-turn-helix domain-containing protein [Actinosynnema]|uniref:helix-turn-helix domain-containing protein n=1 Tax=Actinosynnema TaxID=40566 RepID=UPI0020A246DA|nr:helix-turn-helix domain-containing protein [Actinosynnema pretiosum]MCP2094725.1 hypothetical protein [Actinosynnema pretiosum]
MFWTVPAVRDALARHDIGLVYRYLGRQGVSQRSIAELTRQNQSDVNKIANNRAEVRSYELLARIAEGLGVDRGLMGLAYTAGAHRDADPTWTGEDEDMRRRALLGIAGKLVMGATLLPAERGLFARTTRATPLPGRVGAAEVAQVREVTAVLRAKDLLLGGGSCRAAILGHAQGAAALLGGDCAQDTRADLVSAVAEVKTLAGWTAHDLGMPGEALNWLTQALEETRSAGNPAHTAIVAHHLGRVPLDHLDPGQALKYFQLGRIAAAEADSPLAVAFLEADMAIAYADQGQPRRALDVLTRAQDEFDLAQQEEQHAPYTRFFDRVAMRTAAARVHTRLGMTDSGQRAVAIEGLTRALADIPPDHARQQAFSHALLAACYLAEGEIDTAVGIGEQALNAVRAVRSQRLRGQLTLLREQTRRYPHHSDAQALGREIARFCATAA